MENVFENMINVFGRQGEKGSEFYTPCSNCDNDTSKEVNSMMDVMKHSGEKKLNRNR